MKIYLLCQIYIFQRESTTSVSPTMYPTTHPKVPCNVHVCTEDEEGLFTEVGNYKVFLYLIIFEGVSRVKLDQVYCA